MKKFTTVMTVLLFASNAFAEVNCTKEPTEKWKDQDSFQKELALTYKIKKFKVTKGNCYEIYGWDKADKKVEIYFNPVTGAIVKQKN